MPVESDADILGMFDAADFGVAATWRAGGVGAPVVATVILNQPDVDSAGFGVPVRAGSRVVMVPRATLPLLSKGDTLQVGADLLTVAAVRRTGPDGVLLEAEC
jgi:hypothetical protein